MPNKKDQLSRLRSINIIISLLFALAILAFGCSLPEYSAVTRMVGKILPDGSFDSVSLSEYNVLQWIIRVKAFLLLLAGIYTCLYKNRVFGWLSKLAGNIKKIRLRQDLKTIWQVTFPATDRLFLVVLLLITLGGLLIRLLQINSAVGYDEAYTFIHFASKSLRTITTDYSAPNNHIFHSLLVFISYHLFGNHVWVLRLPALLAGVLTIPAIYMAGKLVYDRYAGLIAAVLTALSPMLADYSVNARGYTLVCLFSGLILWLAAVLHKRSSFGGWSLLALFSILGFYTLPVMIYPVCGVYLWLLLNWLMKDVREQDRSKYLSSLILSALGTIAISFALYLPIILFGTGFSSIVSNEFVQSQNWFEFQQSIIARMARVWSEWTFMVPKAVVYWSLAGFVLNLVLEKRLNQRKIPLWLPIILSITILIVAQRVAPWPRVWLFLLTYFLLFAAGGWSSLFRLVFQSAHAKSFSLVFNALLLIAIVTGYFSYKSSPVLNKPYDGVMINVARFVASILQDNDTIVAVSPVSIQMGYYLTMEGIPFDRIYNKDRKGSIDHAIVVLAERSKFPTLEKVISFQGLTNVLDPASAELVFNSKKMRVYSVPVLP